MTTTINQPRSLSQRTARSTLALVSVLALSAIGAGTASAQTPSTPPAPAAPVAATAADVSVEIDDRDDEAKEGEDHRYRVVVRNDGSTVASGVGVRISLPEEFDPDDMSDESRIVERGDERYDYAVGELAPGQEVTLTIEGEFEDIDSDEDLDASAEVWNSASGSDEDTLEVRVEEDDNRR